MKSSFQEDNHEEERFSCPNCRGDIFVEEIYDFVRDSILRMQSENNFSIIDRGDGLQLRFDIFFPRKVLVVFTKLANEGDESILSMKFLHLKKYTTIFQPEDKMK